MLPPEALPGTDMALKTAKEYADAILRSPLEEVGGILADTVKYWRLKNQVNCLLKAKALLEKKGIKPEQLMPDVFVPLLEAAGDASDPDLAEMFARLLATQLDPQTNELAHPSFAKILSEFSPLDAQIIEFIDQHERSPSSNRSGTGVVIPIDITELRGAFKECGDGRVKLSIENLLRVGLVGNGSEPSRLWLTAFGCRFMTACSGNTTREPLRGNPAEALEEELEDQRYQIRELERVLENTRRQMEARTTLGY